MKTYMKPIILIGIIACLLFLGINMEPSHGAGVCSDEAGVCSSSPFCLGKKVGASCRNNRTCKSLGNKQLQPCCSCTRGRVRTEGLTILPGVTISPATEPFDLREIERVHPRSERWKERRETNKIYRYEEYTE